MALPLDPLGELMSEVKLQIRKDGPILVTGPCEMFDADGNVLTPLREGAVALCRCGASATKPFCDGFHRRVEFSDSPREAAAESGS